MILQKDKENLFYDNDEYEKVKKKTLFKILLTVFIKTLFESFLQPLLPFYILNYYHIEVKELGILLSFYSFSQCIMCLIIGFFSTLNKKYLLIFLILLNLIGIYLFYIKLNFNLLIINRIICGSSSVFIVVVNAIINDLVDKNICIYYTYINIFNAIGIILGPLLSSFFLTIFNFEIILNFNTLGLIVSLLIVLTISSELLSQNQNKLQKKIIKNSHIHTYQNEYISNSNNYTRSDVNNNMNKCTHNNSNNNNSNNNNNNNNNSNNNNGNNNNNNSNNNNGNNGNNLTWSEFNKNNHVNRKNKHTTSSYKKGESSINSYLFNKKTSYSEAPYKGKMFNSHHDEFSDISYQQFLKRKKKKKFILLFVHYIKERLSLLLNRILTYKFKCLLAICLFRFSSAFSANLMSNIFFVFYNDNVSSDNKQIQISVFVSLSGIIMIFYQYFSFSYILEKFGYNGTAIIGLLIQGTGIILTYHSIKYYNLIFQYISICFIHSCSYAYIEPIIPTIISLFFDKNDQLFSQSIVSFFRYLSLTISPIIYSYYYIENQLFPFFISSCMSIVSIFFVILSFKYHNKMNAPLSY
ncbi:major facilitator superfamily domain-containing protein, putative [Plasmodium ovale]|uniref:Major facilitator superfamily domain-containing protein, putative n=1 Tax=Plasmodium ovale TaxID=36330 RepID=A0A1C3KUZ8_PLAOA|nr:major facilitator superfamily domain-containing protein, putative [Plasmodium ovale]